jgi:hypothetical protein
MQLLTANTLLTGPLLIFTVPSHLWWRGVPQMQLPQLPFTAEEPKAQRSAVSLHLLLLSEEVTNGLLQSSSSYFLVLSRKALETQASPS